MASVFRECQTGTTCVSIFAAVLKPPPFPACLQPRCLPIRDGEWAVFGTAWRKCSLENEQLLWTKSYPKTSLKQTHTLHINTHSHCKQIVASFCSAIRTQLYAHWVPCCNSYAQGSWKAQNHFLCFTSFKQLKRTVLGNFRFTTTTQNK